MVYRSMWVAYILWNRDSPSLVSLHDRSIGFDFWFNVMYQEWGQIVWTLYFALKSDRMISAICPREVLSYCWRKAVQPRSKWFCCTLQREACSSFWTWDCSISSQFYARSLKQPSATLLHLTAPVHSYLSHLDLAGKSSKAFKCFSRPNDPKAVGCKCQKILTALELLKRWIFYKLAY